jgi:hypothetical protein
MALCILFICKTARNRIYPHSMYVRCMRNDIYGADSTPRNYICITYGVNSTALSLFGMYMYPVDGVYTAMIFRRFRSGTWEELLSKLREFFLRCCRLVGRAPPHDRMAIWHKAGGCYVLIAVGSSI